MRSYKAWCGVGCERPTWLRAPEIEFRELHFGLSARTVPVSQRGLTGAVLSPANNNPPSCAQSQCASLRKSFPPAADNCGRGQCVSEHSERWWQAGRCAAWFAGRASSNVLAQGEAEPLRLPVLGRQTEGQAVALGARGGVKGRCG